MADTGQTGPGIGPADKITQSSRRHRETYTAPLLMICGDVRSLTLGGSPGISDTDSPSCTPGLDCELFSGPGTFRMP